MGDHFWPAVYPGLIVGLLYGLSQRGFSNAVLGVIGGGFGAAVSSSLLFSIGLNDGLLSAAAMVATSLLCAFGAGALFRLARSTLKP
jgi:hypothetical protein